jgi:enediyne core biosynthesis thioesterase
MRQFEYRHVVTLEETNLVGNVYFTRYFSWQGRCRELFLREYAPEVFDQLHGDLALVTLSSSCDFFDELGVSDEVRVAMDLEDIYQNRVTMGFEYRRLSPEPETVVARGRQEVACMRRGEAGLYPAPIPDGLRRALDRYRHLNGKTGALR